MNLMHDTQLRRKIVISLRFVLIAEHFARAAQVQAERWIEFILVFDTSLPLRSRELVLDGIKHCTVATGDPQVHHFHTTRLDIHPSLQPPVIRRAGLPVSVIGVCYCVVLLVRV